MIDLDPFRAHYVYMKNIIKTEKLCKNFVIGETEQKVLKELDIEIYAGDFTVIMGASGSGKSTLLYALSGMDKPTSGKIEYESQNIAVLSQDELAKFRSTNCGFVFQQIYLVDSMSVLDNVMLSGLLKNKDKKTVLGKAKSLLNSVGIADTHFKKLPSQLSGGEAQRVAVARAVVGSPQILFADEPTGALDSQNSKAVLDVLTELNNQGQSIVMVTHDTYTARRGNRILYLRDGKVEGELKLDKYKAGDDDKRKKDVKQFLNEQGW